MKLVAALVVLGLTAATAAATPPEPSGKHPRLFLDDTLRARLKELAKQDDSAVARAIAKCDDVKARPDEYKRDYYMGYDWARAVHTCLIAWVVRGDDKDADTALKYTRALLEDLENVGDKQGGDSAIERDSGYSMRSLGFAPALAYDWLHDRMSEDLRKLARRRFDAWSRWVETTGYRARNPGNNYHAGFVIGATLMAIAQGGEAGDAGARLWKFVVDEMWGVDMAAALSPGGILDGGDWPEGWQYGPLSVASYALAARAAAANGIAVEGVDVWLDAVLRHAVYGITPGGQFYAAGDAEDVGANIDIPFLIFTAPALGDAAPAVQAWAKAMLRDLKLKGDESPFYEVMAEATPVEPAAPPLADWPTAYLAPASANFYARTGWDASAMWMVTTCRRAYPVDHSHPEAGNVVMSRGKDDVLVDPSPYGSMSSLTSNAPTVDSGHMKSEDRPSQSYFGELTRFRWARQTRSGIVAARCDYADQFRLDDDASDVPEAMRDVVLVPYAGGTSAAMVVIDRARSGDRRRALYLRFRTTGTLRLDGDVATTRVGDTAFTIRRVASSSGSPEVRHLTKGDCFQEGITRGGCETPRIDIDEYRLIVDGPSMTAFHVLDAAAPGKGAPDVTTLDGVDGIVLERDGRTAVVVAGTGAELHYRAPAGDAITHVVVGAPASAGTTVVTAAPGGDGCDVTVSATADGERISALPVVVTLDAACQVTEEPTLAAASQATLTRHAGKSPRSGCCGAQAAPDSSVTLAVLVLLVETVRRRRRVVRR